MKKHEQIAKALGKNLSILRLMRGIPVSFASKAAGIHYKKLLMLELGEPPKNIKLETICKLIDCYNCQKFPLFTQQKEPTD